MYIKNEMGALKNWVDSRKIILGDQKQQVRVTSKFAFGTEEYLVSGYMNGYLFNDVKKSEVLFYENFEDLYDEHLKGINWMANIGRGPSGSRKSTEVVVGDSIPSEIRQSINLQ